MAERAEEPGSTIDLLDRYGADLVPGLPKYARLRETLVAAIRAGRWRAGGRLPAEEDIARATGFSLGTVQRALRQLADSGVLVRSQGSGTFVADGRGSIDAPLHLRFRGRDGEPPFLPLYPTVLARSLVDRPGRWPDWLAPGGGRIVRIDRKLDVGGEFTVYNRFYGSAERFPALLAKPLRSLDGANLKELVGEAAGLPVTDVEESLRLVRLDPEACGIMGVRPGTRGMLLESAASIGRDRPVYVLESFIPPNDRSLDVSRLQSLRY